MTFIDQETINRLVLTNEVISKTIDLFDKYNNEKKKKKTLPLLEQSERLTGKTNRTDVFNATAFDRRKRVTVHSPERCIN
jgi:predicted kinase